MGYIGGKIKKFLVSFSAPAAASLLLALITPDRALADIGIGINFGFGNGFGTGGEGIAESLCTIVGWFTEGGVGAAIASLAVIFLGIGAFFGKVTWGMAIMFAAGIFAIFGAGEIVESITGGLGNTCF